MARFFIDRPVFAWVIAILIVLAGALSITSLPIQQYPTIAPPAVTINATYPGASAETLENTVTQVIEQNMSGLDYLRYISSTSDSAGNVAITLTFEPKADPDIAQVQVQNKLALATPSLPLQVQQLGVKVSKANSAFLMVVGFFDKNDKMQPYDISDFIASQIQDPVSRINGVGQVTVFGAQHSMRIWLDPNKLVSYNLTTPEVVAAIQSQNNQVSAGELGGAPQSPNAQLDATIIAQTRLQTVDQFAAILLKVNPDGSRVYLRDIGRVEMGGENYDIIARYNRHIAFGIGVNLAPGANALQTANAVRAKIDQLRPFFPAGLETCFPLDTTPFVKISIHEVVKTLIEAIVLVFFVMFLFLQSWRATFIPTVAVPVVLMGTFAVLSLMHYSINTLTMFGMVLAIGLLVDDAIVVVENVERVMEEEKLSPKEATKKSMEQITGALIGIVTVLCAVFIPMAFFAGSTGAIYRQFSVTVVSAMLLSVFVALSLTPALCATLLKSGQEPHAKRGFFGWFNRNFERTSHAYTRGVRGFLRWKIPFLVVFVVIVAGLAYLFVRLPSAFLPDEDQGRMFVLVSLPPGSTQNRTLAAVKQVEDYFLDKEKENVDGMFGVVGFSFSGRGQNSGLAFINLKDWSVRKRKDQKVGAIAQRAMMNLSHIRDASVFAIAPPAVSELGNATGFDFNLVDRGGQGHAALTQARNMLLGMAAKDPNLVATRPNGLEDTPQFKIDIDQEKALALGVSLVDINSTLSESFSPAYVNDFIDKGRVKRVYMQGDTPYRMLPSDIDRWYVRNATGGEVPFSSFSTAHWTYGSPRLERFNGVSSMEIQGSPAPGKSTGDAMKSIEAIAAKLPAGFGYEWTGLSYEERQAGSQAPALYAISLIVVFLCLAALYESWSIPLAIMLVVPLGVVGALAATFFRGLHNDVYFQVGLLLTIGLAAKNAILIVEFAKDIYEEGASAFDAAVEAAHQRLRPILMTSFAFILGVLPLALANGAGSGAENAIGTGVVGGMFSATLLTIFFAPLFFVVVYAVTGKRHDKAEKSGGGQTDHIPHDHALAVRPRDPGHD